MLKSIFSLFLNWLWGKLTELLAGAIRKWNRKKKDREETKRNREDLEDAETPEEFEDVLDDLADNYRND